MIDCSGMAGKKKSICSFVFDTAWTLDLSHLSALLHLHGHTRRVFVYQGSWQLAHRYEEAEG